MNTNFSARLSVITVVAIGLLGCSKSSPETSATPSATTSATAPSAPIDPADLSGSYTILSASNPTGGGTYSGSTAIAKRGDLYALDWTIAKSPPYHGVGIVEGGVLGVGWGMGQAYGVAVYKVDGGTLQGKWASSATQKHSGVENLSGPAGLNGTYKITEGKDGDTGKAYTGSVTIKPSGAVYDVAWTTPGNDYSGVGILQGNVFSVGWGTAGKGAGAVAYTVGSKLDGKWAQPKGTSLGTEVLGKN